jgi:aspartate ammonia-lyase
MLPVIVLKTFESICYVTAALRCFTDFCVNGIEADVEACARPLASSVAQATSLVPIIGYEAASKVAKLVAQGATLDAALLQVQGPLGAT